MNYGRKLTAMGLAASVLMTQAGYASAQDALVKTENAEQGYNVLLVTVDAWCVYLFCRNMKGRKLRVWAFSLLLLIPLDIAFKRNCFKGVFRAGF